MKLERVARQAECHVAHLFTTDRPDSTPLRGSAR